MIPLTNHDSSEGEQWGRDEIYPDECTYYIIIYLQNQITLWWTNIAIEHGHL